MSVNLIDLFFPKAQRGWVTCSESHDLKVVKSEFELKSECPKPTYFTRPLIWTFQENILLSHLSRDCDFRVSPADHLPWTILSLSSESRWLLVFPIPCSTSDSPTPLEMRAQQKQIHLNYEKGFAELTHGVWGNWCLNLRSLVSQCLNTAIINKVY